jgi:S1-C subfamily serine protease
MNLLDLLILAVLACAVLGGYRIGFVVGSTAWLFLAQGLVVATLALPAIDEAIGPRNPGTALVVEVGLFFGAGFVGLYLGRWMGRAFRSVLVPVETAETDRRAGAVGGPLAALTLIWLLALPAMTSAPGWFARQANRSLLARGVTAALPEPPDTSRAFARLVGPAQMPHVFAALDPLLEPLSPPSQTGLSAEARSRVAASTVKVDGYACRTRREGSGFTVAPEVVVTNAHVVAGQREPSVVRPDGTRLPAVVTAYDPERDLALLRVRGLGQTPLPLGEPEARTTTAVFGHPDGQEPLQVSPALIRRQLTAKGYDLYATRLVRRDVLVLAADLRPGDSGSAVVNASGAVVGVAFAVSLSTEDMAFALTSEELEEVLATNRTTPVETGDCLTYG